MAGLGKRTFADRGLDAATVVHDAAVMAVTPQIGHAVRAAWERVQRVEEAIEEREAAAERASAGPTRSGRPAASAGTPAASPSSTRTASTAEPRSGAGWGGAGLVLALVSLAFFAQSGLIGSDTFVLPTSAAVPLSAVTMLVALGCVARYERGVRSGSLRRWALLPERSLLIVVIAFAIACVLAAIRLFGDPYEATAQAIAAFLIQLAALVSSIVLLRGANRGAASTRRHAGTEPDETGPYTTGPQRTLSTAGAAEVDVAAERARTDEERYLAALPASDRERIVALQLHALRRLFLDGRLSETGAREAVAAVRSRTGS